MGSVLSDANLEHNALLETKESFEALKREVSNVFDASNVMAEQMKHLEDTRGSIIGSVESLSAISEENAASSEETSASMQELTSVIDYCNGNLKGLKELSDTLNEQVAIFKL